MTTEKDFMAMEKQVSEMPRDFLLEMSDAVNEFEDLMRTYIGHLRDVYILTEQISRELENMFYLRQEILD